MVLAVFLALPPRWLALGYCGVIIHGSMLLTGATTVFIQRYALPVEPIILLAGVTLMDGVICLGFVAIRRRKFPADAA